MGSKQAGLCQICKAGSTFENQYNLSYQKPKKEKSHVQNKHLEKSKIHAAIYPELIRICFNYWDCSLKPQELNFVWESLLSLLIVRERFLSFCFRTGLLYQITRYPFGVHGVTVLWVTRYDFGLCKLVKL